MTIDCGSADAEEARAEGTSSDGDSDDDDSSSLSSGDEAEGTPSERPHSAGSSAGLLLQQVLLSRLPEPLPTSAHATHVMGVGTPGVAGR